MSRPPVSLIALLVVAAALMAWMAAYQIDDAFILYRYARHLGTGHGFTFNPGERVEGATGTLWVFVLAPFASMGLDLSKVAPVLTAICGLACLWVVSRRFEGPSPDPSRGRKGLFASTLLLSFPPFLYWSVGGMEMVPYALALAVTTRLFAREISEERGGDASAMAMGIASWLRPEAPLTALALLAVRWRAFGPRRAVRWGAVFAGFFGTLLVCRHLYFGEWLPNTYYAKSGDRFLSYKLIRGLGYLYRWATLMTPTFGLDPWVEVREAGILLILGLGIHALRRPQWRAEGAVILTVVITSIIEGGDWMPQARFWVPALPALATITSSVLITAGAGRVRLALSAVMAAALVAGGFVESERARNAGDGFVAGAESYELSHKAIALYVAEHAAPGEQILAGDIGHLGWYAPHVRIVDFTGLTDREIAHSPGGFLSKEYPIEKLLESRPRYVQVVQGGTPADLRLLQNPLFQSSYSPVLSRDHRANWKPPGDPYVLTLYERNPDARPAAEPAP